MEKAIRNLEEIKEKYRGSPEALKALDEVRLSMNRLMDLLNEEISQFECEDLDECCSKCEQRAFAIEQLVRLRG
jgi:hypothetical protein